MLRLWVLPVLALTVALGIACSDSGDDKPQATTSIFSATTTSTSPAVVSNSASPTSTLPSATAASLVWKTYSNADYGFSFQYPASWYLDVHGSHPDTTMDYMAIYSYAPQQASSDATPPPDAVKIEFYVGDNSGGLALSDWIRQHDALTGSVATVVTSGDLASNGHVGTERVVTYAAGEGSGKPSGEAYFIAGKSVLIIDGPAADSPGVQSFQDILKRLAFN